MYVPPEMLTSVLERHLNPFDKTSTVVAVVSAAAESAKMLLFKTLNVFRIVSNIYQLDTLSTRLISKNFALNPK
jgi:hypothetical protein